MTPHALDSLTTQSIQTLAVLFAKGIREIPRDSIASTFPGVPKEYLQSVIDSLESREFIEVDDTLDPGLPLELTILPSVLLFAVQPKPDQLDKLKSTFLSRKPIAALVFVVLVAAAIVGILKTFELWPKHGIPENKESQDRSERKVKPHNRNKERKDHLVRYCDVLERHI